MPLLRRQPSPAVSGPRRLGKWFQPGTFLAGTLGASLVSDGDRAHQDRDRRPDPETRLSDRYPLSSGRWPSSPASAISSSVPWGASSDACDMEVSGPGGNGSIGGIGCVSRFGRRRVSWSNSESDRRRARRRRRARGGQRRAPSACSLGLIRGQFAIGRRGVGVIAFTLLQDTRNGPTRGFSQGVSRRRCSQNTQLGSSTVACAIQGEWRTHLVLWCHATNR
jgi:hypothetical protein